jgi:hypothetical protein
VVMHDEVQLRLAPAAQVNPSSGTESQSSSRPLQVSAGGAHAPQVQLAPQVRAPVDPQLVVHEPVVPRQQA